MPNLDRPVNLPASVFSPGGVADLALEAELRDVREITARVFPGPFRVEQVEDPEISGEGYFVFHVLAQGTIEEIVGKHDEWHGKLREIDRERRGIFRLSIDAQ
jgi:hypothetical protein